MDLRPYKCPICGEYEFPYKCSYEICEVCGWQDDIYINEDGNEDTGANRCSPRVARTLWKHGKTMEDFLDGNYTSEDLDGRELDESDFDFV